MPPSPAKFLTFQKLRVSVGGYVHMRPEKEVESPGTRVIDGCEQPNMGVGNQTL